MLTDRAPSAARVRFAYWGSALAIAACACGRPPAQAPPPPKVTVVQSVEREVTEWDEYTARFDAVDSVEVRPRVNGYLQEIHFKDGAMVKKGDLLFLIDPRPYEAVRRRAEAQEVPYEGPDPPSDCAAAFAPYVHPQGTQ